MCSIKQTKKEKKAHFPAEITFLSSLVIISLSIDLIARNVNQIFAKSASAEAV